MPEDVERVTVLKDDPTTIDEIVASGAAVHIERMDDRLYWMRIGDRTFWISGTIAEQK